MANANENDDAGFLREAIRLAEEHSLARAGGPFGALVVRNGVVISRGWNQVLSANDPTAHAEVVAIRAACRELNAFHLEGCDLYATCEPCPMCLAAAYWARVDRLIYAATREDAAAIGFDDARLYREIPRPPAERELPTTQLLRDEAIAIMRRWQQLPGRIVY